MQLESIYSAPGGILLATVGEGQEAERAGCVALRAIALGSGVPTGEIRRMFVRPGFRGHGLGRGLVTRLIDVAQRRGLRQLVLNTLPQMAEAVELYQTMGFRPLESYHSEPAAGVLYFGLELD